MNVVARAVAVVLVGGAAVFPAVFVAPLAHADDCPVMTFGFDRDQGALALSPDTVTVPSGSCVTFNNQTATYTEFDVGSGYSHVVPPFSETVGTGNYQANSPGTTQPVSATSRAGSASGSIVIQSPPAQSSAPAPPPTSAPPPPPSSPPAHPTTHPTPRRTTSPKPVASTPKASLPPTAPLRSRPAGSPPVVVGQTTPTPTQSRHPVVVAGPLQPPTGRGTGLPAAVAAIAIVGTAAALLRVLLAYPFPVVDGRHSVGTTS